VDAEPAHVPAALQRRVIEPDGLADVAPAWRALADRSARTPFELPAWLIPWQRHYGASCRAFLLTWWRGAELVGVAPLAWRRRTGPLAVRELEFWGTTATPLRGWVDVLVDDGVQDEVADDFAAWLAQADPPWDLFNFLYLDPQSPTVPRLYARPRPWWTVDLTGFLHSLDYVLALPSDSTGWQGPLGPKARHEVRRQMRLFERKLGGRFEEITDGSQAGQLVEDLRSLTAARWGDREAYFRRDPALAAFAAEAFGSMLEARTGWALVARDGARTAAVLVVLRVRDRAVALMIGVSGDPAYRAMSLGKGLFYRAIEGAVERGCRRLSFLTWAGDYKSAFWHATGVPLESGFLARGGLGRAVAASAVARRVAPARLRALLAGQRGRVHRG
jgi:CelD/BcsL family acetyltransferase involved in cellulose biosynthesis